MPLIRGDELRPDLQRQVLAMYVHRCTREHTAFHQAIGRSFVSLVPGQICIGCGKPARELPTLTDAEWLRAHAFYVTRRGQLDARRSHCEPAIIADAEVNS